MTDRRGRQTLNENQADSSSIGEPPNALPSLQNLKVVVVGDVMLDRYWHGQADRVSPEAPVPVLNVGRRDGRPGGAANVALNLVSLGAQATLIGYVGEDDAGTELRATLEAAGVVCEFVSIPDWPTIVKLRLIAQKQQLMRADFEEPVPVLGASEREATLLNKVEKHLLDAQVLVLEDYDKGVLDTPQAIIHTALKRQIPVLVDPKHKPLDVYARATVIKPNESEFLAAVGAVDNIGEAAAALCQQLHLQGMVVHRGGDGMEISEAEGSRHVPARQVEVFDVTGAGDTTAATLAIGMALKWSLLASARMANVAASLVVSKSGTSPVTGPELARALRQGRTDRGLISREELAVEVAAARADGERIVFTNGCFDILHAGHVTYLEEAASLGQRLVVAINDDASVTRLKGSGRPVIPVEGRSRVLLGLGCVDWVVSFDEDTPEPLLDLLQPEILVKGGDYQPDTVVGAERVLKYGGQVHVLSLVQDVSTSAIVERIKLND